MPKGERRKRKDILLSQIQTKRDKITSLNDKAVQLQLDIDRLQAEFDDIVAMEQKVMQEANDKELLGILKKHNVSKEQLLNMLSNE